MNIWIASSIDNFMLWSCGSVVGRSIRDGKEMIMNFVNNCSKTVQTGWASFGRVFAHKSLQWSTFMLIVKVRSIY
jgi:hypothetical protein